MPGREGMAVPALEATAATLQRVTLHNFEEKVLAVRGGKAKPLCEGRTPPVRGGSEVLPDEERVQERMRLAAVEKSLPCGEKALLPVQEKMLVRGKKGLPAPEERIQHLPAETMVTRLLVGILWSVREGMR
mmetsp:Transcript_8545/g.24118  ORF Transcript_8545/g.24118 Transcript_8545/m.24118 type:complete len:131 (-) Transcript_8545:186-578(-)